MKTTLILLFVSVFAHAGPLEYFAGLRAHTAGGLPAVVTTGEISQTFDHFSVSETRTFKQRYWITSTFASGSAAPVLLYICGESECGGSPLNYGPLPRIAKETGAYIVAIEHRYYGKSQLFPDLSTANLKYLSTAQAIEDLRSFRSIMKSAKNLSGRWILVGGSYAGNLAAYARMKFPAEFAGAVASSAPVRPEPNFTAYDHHVANLAGRACIADLQKALAEIEETTKTPQGYEQVRNNFGAKSVSRRDDFLYLLSDIVSAAIQLGLKDDFCATVHAKGVAGFREMKLKVDTDIGDFAVYTAEESENISLAKHGSGLGLRQWFYQSCQEYGFWQNAWPDILESAKSHEIDARYHDHLCQRLFNLPGAASTVETRSEYFVPLMSTLTTNVMFTRGSLDPWASLGVSVQDQSTFGPDVSVREIQGALHCEDLMLGGSSAIQAAKAQMGESIKTWLRN